MSTTFDDLPPDAVLARTIKGRSTPRYDECFEKNVFFDYERVVWNGGTHIPWEEDPNCKDYDRVYEANVPWVYTDICIDDEGQSNGLYVRFTLVGNSHYREVSLIPNGDYGFYLFNLEVDGTYDIEMRPNMARYRNSEDGGEWHNIDTDELYDPERTDWVYEYFAGEERPDIEAQRKYWLFNMYFERTNIGAGSGAATFIDNMEIYYLTDKPTMKPFWTNYVKTNEYQP